MKKTTVVMMISLLLGTGIVSAQETLQPTPVPTLDMAGAPNYGAITLNAGFLPDPWIVSAVGGGDVDTGVLSLGTNCTGFVSGSPAFVLQYSGTPLSDNLRVLYLGSGDTTLIINSTFTCADNVDTSDPVVDFPSPAAGAYSIWIGSVGGNTPIHGYLMISEVQSAPGTILTDIAGFVTSFVELTGAPADATIEAQPEVTATPSS